MVTFRIKENSKQAKAVLEMLKTLPFVEIIEDDTAKKKTKEGYRPEFVAEIQKRMKENSSAKNIVVDPKDVWGSIG